LRKLNGVGQPKMSVTPMKKINKGANLKQEAIPATGNIGDGL